ncbi:MAG: hypothetical protein LUH50_03110 [Bacteroides intestinalis]|nr:hypothetical protein [Bacteroides intestinalis]
MNKKIILIVGAYPPDACGIGDYSSQLVHADESHWECIVWKDWTFSGLCKLICSIKKSNVIYINLQYPTKASYGSLIPHLLCIYIAFFSDKRFMVTLHEFMRMGLCYRLAAIMFLLFANKVIFTTQVERKYASNIIPFRKNQFVVIPIYSNIAKAHVFKATNERNCDIAYFGLISPNRNIEHFIDLVKKIEFSHKCISAKIIGMIVEGSEDFLNFLRKEAQETCIEFHLNKSNEEVAELLNDCRYTYLPFHDGVSERRGSFLASVLNGAIVITTKGPWTSSKFDKVCYYIDSDELHLVKKILDGVETSKSQIDIFEYLQSDVAKSWVDVSDKYLNLCR